MALGLTYAMIAMDLDINLGFIRVKKKGLTGDQQRSVINKTIDPVLKAIGVLT